MKETKNTSRTADQSAGQANGLRNAIKNFNFEDISKRQEGNEQEQSKTSHLLPTRTISLAVIESDKQTKLVIDCFPFKIGRLQITNLLNHGISQISRRHAEITNTDGMFYIRDLSSKNGTYLNKAKMQHNMNYELHQGDLITLANIDCLVEWLE